MTGKQFGWQGWLLLMALMVSPVEAHHAYTFSIGPQQAATKTALIWGPVMQYLEQRTGYQFQLVTARNGTVNAQGLDEGQYDFSYMNPYYYTVFHERQGYEALVRARDRVIKGIVVVPIDSPVQDIRELAGKKLAFPAPASFAASLLTQGNFAQQGIPVTPVYVGSHDSVYLNVAKGFFPAGGGILRTLKGMTPEIRDQLRVLWASPGYTPHAIAVHPRVPLEVAEAVQQALMDLDSTEVGRSMLDKMNIKGFTKAENADWNDVRALDLAVLQSDDENTRHRDTHDPSGTSR